MRPPGSRALLAAACLTVASIAGAQTAGGAPAPPSKAPSIDGYPGYHSVLTCKPGTWAADARSFTYSWLRQEGFELGRGQRYRAKAETVGYQIRCRVTATDAAGAATTADSAPVLIGRGRTTIRLKAASPQTGGKVRLTGRVGPLAALKPHSKGRPPGRIVAYREERDGLYQLFGKYRLSRKTGRFSITAPDELGRNRYKVNFNPNEISLWEAASAHRKVHLKR